MLAVSPVLLPVQPSLKPRVLICDIECPGGFPPEVLRGRGYPARSIAVRRSTSLLRDVVPEADLLLIDLTTSSREVTKLIQEIIATIGICSIRPRVLCFSTAHRNSEFLLSIQRAGARYARVGSLEMLCEAIDLLFTEIRELERNGPHFEIVHSYSTGVCTAGEEISAVLLENAGDVLQLPFGLAERFVFDLLARRRMAVDSLQIVSGLGDWFYREHASNSGHRQVKRVRLAVKVLVQRIRDAMGSSFSKLQLGVDPYNVLRSCPAEGTNRVLYKLCANISWRHAG